MFRVRETAGRVIILIRLWYDVIIVMLVAVGMLVGCLITVIRVGRTIDRLNVVFVVVGMGIWAVERVMDGMLVVVDRFNIVLVIKSMV